MSFCSELFPQARMSFWNWLTPERVIASWLYAYVFPKLNNITSSFIMHLLSIQNWTCLNYESSLFSPILRHLPDNNQGVACRWNCLSSACLIWSGPEFPHFGLYLEISGTGKIHAGRLKMDRDVHKHPLSKHSPQSSSCWNSWALCLGPQDMLVQCQMSKQKREKKPTLTYQETAFLWWSPSKCGSGEEGGWKWSPLCGCTALAWCCCCSVASL